MDPANCELASKLVSNTYIQQGSQALTRRHKLIKALLSQRKLPLEGWDDATIELFIQDAALMDSNNFLDNVGVGEREARVASELVARRHWRLAHGIGRSGDVSAEQPKAAGSSLLVQLTNLLAADALEVAGMREVGAVLVVPLATGMAITTTLLALRSMRPPTARYVLWPRVDQKTCLKSITAAGFEVVVIPMQRTAGTDELTTDMGALLRQLEELGAPQVACIVTTTSCFAPRAADDIVAVAKLCRAAGVPHIINNAYGVQSRALCKQVTSAWRKGRVDCVVQSTDKNFMVPVGGALIAARKGHTELVERVNGLYPGRASMAPILDLLITWLHWGAAGWRRALQQREEMYNYAFQQLQGFAEEVGERVLSTPGNPISLALTLNTLTVTPDLHVAQPQPPSTEAALPADSDSAAAAGPHRGPEEREGGRMQGSMAAGEDSTSGREGARQDLLQSQQAGQQQQQAGGAAPAQGLPITLLGSMLFTRCVSGTRVVARGKQQAVGGVEFAGYGAHCDDYPCDYLTVAAALGTSHRDIDGFIERARQCFGEFRRKQQRQQPGPA